MNLFRVPIVNPFIIPKGAKKSNFEKTSKFHFVKYWETNCAMRK